MGIEKSFNRGNNSQAIQRIWEARGNKTIEHLQGTFEEKIV
jgi:hypothetical protein